VVTDLSSRAVDFEPLNVKDAKAVYLALSKIYKRNILSFPKECMQVDSGSEFKGTFKNSLEKKEIFVRTGRANRHNQQALVEWYNGVIGKVIMLKQLSNEIETGVEDTSWIKYLANLRKALNKMFFRIVDTKKITPLPKTGSSEDILPIGTTVRVILDQPTNYITGKRLHGKFRSGDIRWNKMIRKIEQFYITPAQPTRYKVSGIGNALYRREELQVIDADKEIAESKYIIEKLVKKRKKKGRVEYLVKWKGYNKQTWEPRAQLIKDVPAMVRAKETRKI